MKRLILFLLCSICAAAQGGNIPTIGVTYSTLQVADPTADNGTGTYANDVTVTVSDSTSGATIYTCTGAGADCTPADLTNPVSVTANSTHVCAKATKSGYTDSNTVCWTYTLQVATPTSTPALPYTGAAGNLTFSSTTSGAAIHYNTTGPTASCSDTLYSSPISVSSTTTFYWIACKTNYANSSQASGTYTVQTVSYAFPNKAQDNGSCSGASNCSTQAFSTALTNPSVIVACSLNASAAASPNVPTDTATNTYVDLGPANVNYNGSALALQCWYAQNTHTTASNVVSINTNTTGTWGLLAVEITGAATSNARDGGSGVGYSSSGANQTTSGSGPDNVNAGTMVTVTNNDLILAVGTCLSTSNTAGTGYTLTYDAGIGEMENRNSPLSPAGSVSPKLTCATASNPYAAVSVAFKPQ